VKPRIGAILVSTADETTVVVIRWGPRDLDLTCGGAPMVDQADRATAPPAALDPARAAGTYLGKWYRDHTYGVELLCTRAGWGSLAVNGVPLDLARSTREPPAVRRQIRSIFLTRTHSSVGAHRGKNPGV